MRTIVITDTETTGLSPDDHIWEFAAIRRGPDGQTTRHHAFVEHDLALVKALPDSFRADHDARYDPTTAITPGELVERISVVFAGRPHVAGAVPNFDTERYARLLRHYGIDTPPWHYHLLDVETLARGYLLGRASRGDLDAAMALEFADDSDALSRAVGVEPPGEGVRHTAMGDCEWALAVLLAVTGEGSSSDG